MKHLALIILVLIAANAFASVRAFLIPGKAAILVMEAISAGKIDLDPRRLYDAIAIPSQATSGGEGKIIKTDDKNFNLVCGTRNTTRDSVLCNITVKPSENSEITYSSATFSIGGAVAHDLNVKFGAGREFRFSTSSGDLTIVSTPEHFDFVFKQGS